MRDLVSGAIVMGYLVAGLFFLRFWRESAERLFLIFGIAFWILAVQRGLLSAMAGDPDTHVYVYGIRLLAFVLIIAAILDKNRKQSSSI
ncbi:hypothetical protein BH23GEM6_BH23GEM6_21620 [soil metagenome]